MKKIWRHDKCRGKVSKKTGICNKCNTKPDGNHVTLVRLGVEEKPTLNRSQRNMRYENLLGIDRSLLGYPRQ